MRRDRGRRGEEGGFGSRPAIRSTFPFSSTSSTRKSSGVTSALTKGWAPEDLSRCVSRTSSADRQPVRLSPKISVLLVGGEDGFLRPPLLEVGGGGNPDASHDAGPIGVSHLRPDGGKRLAFPPDDARTGLIFLCRFKRSRPPANAVSGKTDEGTAEALQACEAYYRGSARQAITNPAVKPAPARR